MSHRPIRRPSGNTAVTPTAVLNKLWCGCASEEADQAETTSRLTVATTSECRCTETV